MRRNKMGLWKAIIQSETTPEKITSKNLGELAQTRSEVYKILAQCFSEPSKEIVKDLRGTSLTSSLKDFLEKIDLENPNFNEGNNDLETYIKKNEDLALDDLHLNLRIEDARLFIGPRRLPSPPYESVYRTEGRLVMGESTVEVKKMYEKAGLQIVEQYTDLPDHIALELEFMYFLCVEEANAWKKDDKPTALKHLEMQKEFLDEHLMRWVPKFCDSVVNAAKLEFYRGLAKIAKEFIVSEQDRTDPLLKIAKSIKH